MHFHRSNNNMVPTPSYSSLDAEDAEWAEAGEAWASKTTSYVIDLEANSNSKIKYFIFFFLHFFSCTEQAIRHESMNMHRKHHNMERVHDPYEVHHEQILHHVQ